MDTNNTYITVREALSQKVAEGCLNIIEKFMFHNFRDWAISHYDEDNATIINYMGGEWFKAYIHITGRRVNVTYFIPGQENEYLTYKIRRVVNDIEFLQIPPKKSMKVREFYTHNEYTMKIKHYEHSEPTTCFGHIQVSYKGRSYRVSGYAKADGIFHPQEYAEIMIYKYADETVKGV